jgi:hypothetical protein
MNVSHAMMERLEGRREPCGALQHPRLADPEHRAHDDHEIVSGARDQILFRVPEPAPESPPSGGARLARVREAPFDRLGPQSLQLLAILAPGR